MAVSQDQLLTVINEASKLRATIASLNEVNDELIDARDELKYWRDGLVTERDELRKEVEDLRLKNTQLKRWVMNLVKSRQKVKAAYSHDMRRITEYSQTLTAITEQYSNKYAQHILETPLPE
jgi:uncharacterized coiled-coil DUF342 family protein